MNRQEYGLTRRSHENRGGGRRDPKKESAKARQRKCRAKKNNAQKKWTYAVKRGRETLVARRSCFAKMKENAKGFLPRALLPEDRTFEPCVALRHGGKGSVILGRVLGVVPKGRTSQGVTWTIIEIKKVLCANLKMVSDGGPHHKSQHLALPRGEVYQVPLAMALREGVVWRESERASMSLKINK